jgi:hypothetical protein
MASQLQDPSILRQIELARAQLQLLAQLLDQLVDADVVQAIAAEESGHREGAAIRIEPRSPSIPSPDLTLKMLNVTREDLLERGAEDPDSLLDEMSSDIRDELLGTIAQFALAALDRGLEKATLSHGNKLDADFASELMRSLPIDPYEAPQVLNQLQSELRSAATNGGALRASWGHIAEEPAGDLVLILNQTAGTTDAPVPSLT